MAGRSSLATITRRRDFLAAARAQRWVTPGFIVQARRRHDGGGVRLGLTASRKVGGAVVRNRVKRRLRALAREILPAALAPGLDIVLVGRTAAAALPFDNLRRDLKWAVKRLKLTDGEAE